MRQHPKIKGNASGGVKTEGSNMRTYGIMLCIVLFELVSSNEQAINKKGINVQGCVTDSASKMPVPNARVTVLCWYHSGWDKADYVSIDTIADKNGCFKAKFEEGYKIVSASVAAKYYPSLKSMEELNSRNFEISLKLRKKKDTTDVGEPKINLRYYIAENSSN